MHPLPPAYYRQEHGCKEGGGGSRPCWRLCAHLWADALVPVCTQAWEMGVPRCVLFGAGEHTPRRAMQNLQECEVQECALCVQHVCMS